MIRKPRFSAIGLCSVVILGVGIGSASLYYNSCNIGSAEVTGCFAEGPNDSNYDTLVAQFERDLEMSKIKRGKLMHAVSNPRNIKSFELRKRIQQVLGDLEKKFKELQANQDRLCPENGSGFTYQGTSMCVVRL